MTASICQRVPLAASDERVIGRHSAARHDRAVAAAGVLPAKPRHAGCGLISLPRLSAHDHILGVHQRAAIFPPCPASGQRRSSF
jgi:hypothetical protein